MCRDNLCCLFSAAATPLKHILTSLYINTLYCFVKLTLYGVLRGDFRTSSRDFAVDFQP
jgi:hypothetical protein